MTNRIRVSRCIKCGREYEKLSIDEVFYCRECYDRVREELEEAKKPKPVKERKKKYPMPTQ